MLILRDVLQWRTTEVAALLEMTAAAVNGALQRARDQVPLSEDDVTEPAEPRQRALLDRYVTAFETADVDRHALHVLTISGEGVSRIVAFHGSGLFPLFGL
ncbi:hypothetical protein [Nocardia sp. BSTN01]|uniref:hypothetical protein n=1 Tax=Nocardia sp. BSTN01 TaxID=2783665 RepID=UPI001E4C14F1|nr:hypothetical protein [Nocardia sp. BSTN01]